MPKYSLRRRHGGELLLYRSHEGRAYRVGDIDRSGRIDVRDAVLLCIKIAKGDADADINGDGRLNVASAPRVIIFQG